jgi:hypothetical protein
MLTEQFPFLDPAAITIDLAERLQKLADDCTILAQGGIAPPSHLRDRAPTRSLFPSSPRSVCA